MRLLGLIFLLLTAPTLVLGQPATSKLTGTVYDAQGSVVARAKVTAVAEDGTKSQVVTNDDGVYVLNLRYNPYSTVRSREARYDIVVEAVGFLRSETKGFVFIPSQFGKMTLDIGLQIAVVPTLGEPVAETKASIKRKEKEYFHSQ